jgi:hypothetical protein
MKNLLLLALIIGGSFNGISQTVLWSDDFSDTSTWTMTNTSAPTSINWTIEYSGAGFPDAALGALNPFLSNSAANGFGVISSDGVPGNVDGDGAIVAEITTATPINLTGSPFVFLTFVHNYKWWQDARGVRVSGNNGLTWTDFPITSAAGGVFPNGYPNNQISENPVTEAINISAVAGGMSQVLVQFYYNDNDFWAWYWVVDDVEIIAQPTDDVINLSALLSGTTNNGVYYGRTPLDHIDANYNVGSRVTNFGVNSQTNVSLSADFSIGGGNVSSTSTPSMLSEDTTTLSSVEPNFLSLPVGLYPGTYTVTSDQEFGGVNFGNNTLLRNFEITDYWYSQDGIGVHPAGSEVISNIGTGSFVGAEDGLVLATKYYIKQATEITSLRVMLGSGTLPGGWVFGSIKDTSTFIQSNMTSLWDADPINITAADTINGYVDLIFPGGAFLAPGTYYAAVELLSNSSTSPINVLDDQTVTQPVMASAIYIPGDQTYTNGQCIAIRMLQEDCPGFSVNTLNQKNACFGLTDGSILVDAIGSTGTPSYLWSTGGTTSSISNLATGTYTVTITDTSGCSVQESYTIIENPQMIPEPWSNDETCAALNDGTAWVWMFSGGIGPISYQWSTGDTVSSIAGLDNGTYTYTMTDSVGCSVSGPVTIGTGTVDFSLGVQASVTSGTSPLPVIFDNQTPNLTNYTFTWFFGSHTYLVDGLWDVVLIAVDDVTGCIDTLFLNGYIFTTGGVPCTHTASINQFGPYTFCQGDSVLLTCNNNPAFTYQWNLNGIGLSGENNDSIYAMLDGDYTVTIYENSCPVVSSAVTVNVNASPPTPVIIGTGTITACAGGSVTLDAPLGYAGYLWSTGGTGTSEVVTTSGNYTVEITDGSGCSSISAPYVINASFMAIQEICLVGLDSASNNNRIIWEHPVTTGIDSFYVYKEGAMANVYDKIGATHYLDTAMFIDQNSNPAVQAYRYKVAILDTCGTETALGDLHKTIHLTINQGVGQTWNLIWSHYEGFTFPSYNIYRGSTPGNMTLLTTIASNLNSYTDLTPPGGVAVYYQIEIVNPNPCDPILKMTNFNNSLSNIVMSDDAGIQDLINNGTLSIYPNPTKGELIIKTSMIETPFDITILDAQGKIIMSERCDSDLKEMNISSLEAGIYFVRVNNDSMNKTVRIVKQ